MKSDLSAAIAKIAEAQKTAPPQMQIDARDDILTRIQNHNFNICMIAVRHASFDAPANFFDRYDAFLNYLDDLTVAVEGHMVGQRQSGEPLSAPQQGQLRNRLARDAVFSGLRSGYSPEFYAEKLYAHPFMNEMKAEWTQDSLPNEEESNLLSAVLNQTRIHDELIKLLDTPTMADDENLRDLAIGKANTIDDVAIDIYRSATDQAKDLIKHMESESGNTLVYGQLAHSSVRANYVNTAIQRLRHGSDGLSDYITDEWARNPLSHTKMIETGVIAPWMRKELMFNSAAIVTMLDNDPRILTSKTYFRAEDVVSKQDVANTESSVALLTELGLNEDGSKKATESIEPSEKSNSIARKIEAAHQEMSVQASIEQSLSTEVDSIQAQLERSQNKA